MAKWMLPVEIISNRAVHRRWAATVIVAGLLLACLFGARKREAVENAEKWLREHGAKEIDNG